MTVRVGGNIIAGAQDTTKIQRNIGEIVTSTIPLTDAGLHLLDGSLIVAGIYEDFVTYIAGLVSSYPDLFCSESDWQTSVTTYGVCGKFVYTETQTDTKLYYGWGGYFTTSETPQVGDSVYRLVNGNINVYGTIISTDDDYIVVDNIEDMLYRTPSRDIFATVKTVRLPKITGFTEGTTDVTALGNLIEAGLPNIRGGLNGLRRVDNIQEANDSALYWSTLNYSEKTVVSDGTSATDPRFDASRSNSIYGNSTTVQPQSIKILYYIVVASSRKTNIEVDIDEIVTDLNAKANVSFDNLNSTSANIANWSNNVTNCITEIPQDIKLELNNGTLTLKAGSKVYVPNGFESDGTTPHFDVMTLQSDITHTNTSGYQGYCLIFVSSNLQYILTAGTPSDTSSTSDWSYIKQYDMRYNTAENKIKWYDTDWSSMDFSLPIGICSVSSTNGITSIDQIFNGFGYIGSTVYTLPGVKGLIPDGRNADGSLKNIEFTTSNVLTSTQEFTGWNGKWSLYLNASNTRYHPTELEYISDTKPTGVYTQTAYWYSSSDNKLYFTQDTGATWTQSNELHCVDYTENNTKITSLTSKTTFRILDYNDFNKLFNNKLVLVNELPASPNPDVWYAIPEE